MSERNASREGQCTRSARCTKGKGHAGWCRTKGSGTDVGQDQDSLFASLSAAGRQQRPARAATGTRAGRAAGMQELARKREKGRRSSRVVVEDYEDDDDYEDEDDEGEDGEGEDEQGEEEEEGSVEYADHGLSKAERKAIRERGTVAASADGVPVGDDEDADSAQWEAGGGAASLPELESIRLGRQILEKWLLEPFFARVVRGCVVRIGLQVTDGQSSPAHGTTLYRAAEVTGVKEFEEHPYMLGQRRTCKRLQLEFGESRQCYPMSSVSNHPFEELELRAWQQVLEATGRPLISANQLRCKTGELAEATHYSYSEADVTRRIEEERKERAQAGKPSTLTTRQKLLQQHAGEGGGGGGGAARPMKFQRDVLGRAIVAEHEE